MDVDAPESEVHQSAVLEGGDLLVVGSLGAGLWRWRLGVGRALRGFQPGMR